MPFILYFLTHSMVLKFISLSIQFLLFKVVQQLHVPHIYVLSKTTHCPLSELCHINFLSVYVLLPVPHHLIKVLKVSVQLLVSSLDTD